MLKSSCSTSHAILQQCIGDAREKSNRSRVIAAILLERVSSVKVRRERWYSVIVVTLVSVGGETRMEFADGELGPYSGLRQQIGPSILPCLKVGQIASPWSSRRRCTSQDRARNAPDLSGTMAGRRTSVVVAYVHLGA